MKAALCFSGRATKNSNFCIDNLKRFFIFPLKELGYEVDIFLHLWKIEEWERAIEDLNPLSCLCEEDRSEEIKLEFEKRIFDKHEERIRELNPNVWKGKLFWYPYTPNMFLGIQKANDLKSKYEQENNFKYDLVTRMRTDNVSTKGSYKEELKKVVGCPSKTLWIPTDYIGTRPYPSPEFYYVVDNFAIGGSEALDVYAKTYSEIEDFFELGFQKYQPSNWPKEKLKGAYWQCGTMLGTTIKKYGVTVIPELAEGFTVLRKLRSKTKAAMKRKEELSLVSQEWLKHLDNENL